MANIKITPRLAGTLSQAYYKEFCDQHGYAYTSLERIHEVGIEKGVLKFKKGFNRIMVKLPDEIINEVKTVSRPSNSSILKPSFVYDFLACKVGQDWKERDIMNVKNKHDFCWVDVKTGNTELTPNQISTLKKITIPLYRFRVPTPFIPSREVTIYWDKVDSKYLSRFDYLDFKR